MLYSTYASPIESISITPAGRLKFKILGVVLVSVNPSMKLLPHFEWVHVTLHVEWPHFVVDLPSFLFQNLCWTIRLKMTSPLKNTILLAATCFFLAIAAWVVLMQRDEGLERVSTGQNLKGNYRTKIVNNETRARLSPGVCLVSLIDIEIDDGTDKTQEKDGEEILVCNRVSDHYDNGVSDEMLYLRNVDAATVISNQAALMKNEWFIEFSHDWVEPGRHVENIKIPDNQALRTIDPVLVPHHIFNSPSNRRLLKSKLDQRRRKLVQTTGNRTVVIVSVDLKLSQNQLYDHFFGSNNSLVTQMASCSQNQVNILPHPVHPIIEVSPPKDVSKYTFVELYTTVLSDIKRALKLKNGQSITSVANHLFLVVPDAIDRRPGELGWGATPGFFAGTIESLSISRSTMTLLHGECDGVIDPQ